jgi:two-component system OmpR family response regulator
VRGSVLVVDDEQDVRDSIAAVLQTHGFAVTAATDGRDALRLLDELAVDVIVLDMRMPHLCGVALLELLEDPPVAVVVSADPVDASVRRRLGAKVHDYLAKPFDPRALVAAVAAACGSDAG